MLKIRDAEAQDVDTLVRFNLAMARETEDLGPDREVLRQGVRAVIGDSSKGRYFVAERQGAVAGALLVTYEWSDWRNAAFWWIQSVYVEPAHRRAGIFTALYRHIAALAVGAGACGLRLYVHQNNALASSVYRKLGMVQSEYRVMETPDVLRG